MAIHLMRHPRPQVADGVCYGATDLAIAEPFEAALAAALQAAPVVGLIVTSPLQRRRRLAEAVAQARGAALVVDPRVREMDFGAWEGRPWAELPRTELDAWAADFMHARPHGGESVAMLAARVDAALEDHRAGQEDRLIVTHAGVMKAAFRQWRAEFAFGGVAPL